MAIKDKSFYSVSGWMINQLGLEGNDLICYAIIFSLSQNGEGRYVAGLNYLAEFMQCSQPTASKSVKSLFKKGLIDKDEVVTDYGRRVFYYCKDAEDEKEHNEGVHKNFMDGCKKDLCDNINGRSINTPTKEEVNNKKIISNDIQKKELFDILWSKYSKGNKKNAVRQWNKLTDKEKQDVINKIDDYLIFCRRSGREMKDTCSYLYNHYFEDDWTAIPDCYVVKDGDSERVVDFKNYMVKNFPDLLYHRKPLTFEQGKEIFEKYMQKQAEWGLHQLCQRDIHQYYSIADGLTKVLEEQLPIFDEDE